MIRRSAAPVADPRAAALAVRVALDRSPALDAVDVLVQPVEDAVELSGVVARHAERLAALQLALLAADPVCVIDRLRVAAPIGDRADDATTAAEVARRLAAAGYELGDDVQVDHRVARLRGEVPSFCARCEVRHLVQGTPGVDVVEEELRIAEAAR